MWGKVDVPGIHLGGMSALILQKKGTLQQHTPSANGGFDGRDVQFVL